MSRRNVVSTLTLKSDNEKILLKLPLSFAEKNDVGRLSLPLKKQYEPSQQDPVEHATFLVDKSKTTALYNIANNGLGTNIFFSQDVLYVD